jgi:hypothetical protein
MKARPFSSGASIENAGTSIKSIMRSLTNEVCIELITLVDRFDETDHLRGAVYKPKAQSFRGATAWWRARNP